MVSKRFGSLWAAAVSLLLASATLNPVTPALALDGSQFDPGLIISDSVFYDFGTMTPDEIQLFLESQVPVCKSGSNGMPCLRNFKADTPAKAADPGKCAEMPAKTNVSAAQIIYDIAHACGINPRVLLVILQKEQGLVQSSIPSPYMYRAAMGYGCPDSDPGICGNVWSGLFNQLYKAAGQLQWYGDPNGSFTYLRPGRLVSISYHPDASRNCGKRSFILKNQATANLYYYTPFTPNQAALDNLRGTGDRCSAYGNRNFWRYYWDWFGSPIGGGFLLKSATSDPYFISNDIKYPITDPDLVKDLAPLGPLGTISTEYLDSFKTGAEMTRLIKSAPVNSVSTYFFVSSGKKYLIANCDQAKEFGLDCANAVQLTQVQLDALPTGPFRSDITGVLKTIPVAPANASYFLANSTTKYPYDCAKASTLGFSCQSAVPTADTELSKLQTVRLGVADLSISNFITNPDGARYIIAGGQKHEILDDESLTDQNIPNKPTSPLKIEAFSYLPWGAPIAKQGSLFVNRSTKALAVIVDGKYFEIQPESSSEINFAKWFRFSNGTLSSLGVSSLSTGPQISSLVVDENSQTWLLSDSGKILVTDSADWTKQATPITNAVLSLITANPDVISGFNFVRAGDKGPIYLLQNGQLRETYNSADRDILGDGMATKKVFALPSTGLAFIPKSVMVLPTSVVVQNRKTSEVGIIDGPTRMVTIAATSLKLTLPQPRVLSPLQLVGYGDIEQLGPYKIRCHGTIYIVSDQMLHPIAAVAAKDYPGRSVKLSKSTCALFDTAVAGEPFGNYVGIKTVDPKTKKTKYQAYKILMGKKLPFRNLGDYKLENTSGIPISWVSESFLSNLPLGNQIVIPSKENPGAAPAKQYTIVSGDSLISIANKFKTTVSELMKINSIPNADRISIGQVIKLP